MTKFSKTQLTEEEIQSMVNVASCLRDKLIVALLAETGCSVSELINIWDEDIDFEKGLVVIRGRNKPLHKHCPKCNRLAWPSDQYCSHCGSSLANLRPVRNQRAHRMVSIGRDTMELIQQYLTGREEERARVAGSKYLINLTRQGVYYVVRELADSAGLKARVLLNPKTGKQHFVSPENVRKSLPHLEPFNEAPHELIEKRRYTRQRENVKRSRTRSALLIPLRTDFPVPTSRCNLAVESLTTLSLRTQNSLRRGSIVTVDDLLNSSPKELLSLRNFGTKSLDEINKALHSLTSR